MENTDRGGVRLMTKQLEAAAWLAWEAANEAVKAAEEARAAARAAWEEVAKTLEEMERSALGSKN